MSAAAEKSERTASINSIILIIPRTYVTQFLTVALAIIFCPGACELSSIRTIFIAGLAASMIALALTCIDLQRQNLWPLFDNLRIPRLALIAIPALATALINIVLLLCLPATH